MATDRASKSASPIPTTETGPASTVTPEQYIGMQNLLHNIYEYRTKDDHDPSKLFHRKVNKRAAPDYYDVIREPMAMSTVKQKINVKAYKSFVEYVRDWALIPHNAQVYNLSNSGAYQDALVIKGLLGKELEKLVKDKVITEEEAKLPFLGEIPPQEDGPVEDAEEDEDAEASEIEEEDDDDEEDDSDEEGGRRRKRRGPRGTLALKKRESQKFKEEDDDPESRKKRGRPPRVDTPMEARIKEILKGMRKFKNATSNSLMVYHFERLPDKSVMPEYYNEVKIPIALDVIKKKLKRKKYSSVDQVMKDIDLMFENAKSYNTDESEVYKDAVLLQKETRKIADEVRKKPDTDYVMEDGRIPMPDGILHNGELWKVGDWVHLQNANDLTKPIVAQIYRTWQDVDGNKWVNACWYYRPEQTIHRFDRHFYENEVVKTGQYRDHPIEEVVDRCFVMFFTRFNKGRPRNFPTDKEIYVCEARYNEEKHKLNKIKTWASCLPDEMRDKDYEMDLFDAPKKMKKVPSPLKYLFKEDEQKETDDLPKPVWGAPNAPPKIGAVHCRPRDPKESPPPEPTPTPPPPPPPPPPRQISTIAAHPATNGYSSDHRPTDITIPGSSTIAPMRTPTPSHQHPTPTYTPSHFNQHQPTPSPAPMIQPMPPSVSQYRPPALTPASSFQSSSAPIAPMNNYSTASGPTGYAQPPRPSMPGPQARYEAKPDPDVYLLPDHANNTIPEDIRRQFQCDAYGRVLFFTAPPVDTEKKVKLGHTAKYMAWKSERDAKIKEKRKREAEVQSANVQQAKRAKSEEARVFEDKLEDAKKEALERMNDVLAQETVAEYKALYGDRWQQALDLELKTLEKGQDTVARRAEIREKMEAEWKERERKNLAVRPLSSGLQFSAKQ